MKYLIVILISSLVILGCKTSKQIAPSLKEARPCVACDIHRINMKYEIEVELISLKILNDSIRISSENDSLFNTRVRLPSFKYDGEEGMYSFINKNIKYPVVSYENGIEADILVCFNISPSISSGGRMEDVHLLNKTDTTLGKEALRAVRMMPNWNPASIDRKPIKSQGILKFSFKILHE